MPKRKHRPRYISRIKRRIKILERYISEITQLEEISKDCTAYSSINRIKLLLPKNRSSALKLTLVYDSKYMSEINVEVFKKSRVFDLQQEIASITSTKYNLKKYVIWPKVTPIHPVNFNYNWKKFWKNNCLVAYDKDSKKHIADLKCARSRLVKDCKITNGAILKFSKRSLIRSKNKPEKRSKGVNTGVPFKQKLALKTRRV